MRCRRRATNGAIWLADTGTDGILGWRLRRSAGVAFTEFFYDGDTSVLCEECEQMLDKLESEDSDASLH